MEAAGTTRDHVRFDLPADPMMLTVVRMGVSAVAALLEFGIDDLEDLRLAVSELCSSCAAGASEKSRIHLQCAWDRSGVEVSCEVSAIDLAEEPSGGGRTEIDLSERILAALVDAHGIDDVVGGVRRGWFIKGRASTAR